MIAGAGSLIGCLSARFLTWGVSHIPIRVRGLLYADHFLVAWDWRHYLWATVAGHHRRLHRQLCAGATRVGVATSHDAARFQRVKGALA